MQIVRIEQKSPEWWDLKVGKISGTRFGQVISNRKNALVYNMMTEIMQGFIEVSDYIDEDMQYGIDNEPVGISFAEQQEGIKFESVGAILSDFSSIHMASPDGLNEGRGIVAEVKCTQSVAKHVQRFFEGVESAYLPQCINYFAVSNDVKEVWFISYCGFDDIRPMHIIKLKRENYLKEIEKGRAGVSMTEKELNEKIEQYKKINNQDF